MAELTAAPEAKQVVDAIRVLVRYGAAVARTAGVLPGGGDRDDEISAIFASTMKPHDAHVLVEIAARFEDAVERRVKIVRASVVASELVDALREKRSETTRARERASLGKNGVAETVQGRMANAIVNATKQWDLKLFSWETKETSLRRKIRELAAELLAPPEGTANRQGYFGSLLSKALGREIGARTVNGLISAFSGKAQNQGEIKTPKEARAFAFMEPVRRDIALWCVSVVYPDLGPAEIANVADAMNAAMAKGPPLQAQASDLQPTAEPVGVSDQGVDLAPAIQAESTG